MGSFLREQKLSLKCCQSYKLILCFRADLDLSRGTVDQRAAKLQALKVTTEPDTGYVQRPRFDVLHDVIILKV